VIVEQQMSELLMRMKRFAPALEHAERALAIREKARGADHPDVADALTLVGQLQWEQRDATAALIPLERAVKILEHHEAAPLLLALARFNLARALWDAGRDRRRAHALAVAARGNMPQTDRAELEGWLRQHP
jgi:hypothetical protein